MLNKDNQEKKLKFVGHLVGNKIVVDSETGFTLFREKFFGNPIGVQKAKRTKYSKPYILDFFEAIYLCEEGMLRVLKDDKELSLEELKKIANKNIPHFDYKYCIYRDLRSKGYIVRSGLKYGAEWLVYHYGPDVEHAFCVVLAVDPNTKLLGKDLIGAGRLAHSVRKRIALAFVKESHPGKAIVKYYIFTWFKP